MDADMKLMMVKEGVELLDKGVVAVKKIDAINALDKAGALVVEKVGDNLAYELRTPNEKFSDNLGKAQAVADFAKNNFPQAAENIDKRIAYELRTPKEKLSDNLDMAQDVVDFAGNNFPQAKEAVDQIVNHVLVSAAKELGSGYKTIKRVVWKQITKDRGSKVKADRFEDCPIVYAGNVSYIEIVDGMQLYLTPECVESCTYDRKKYKAALGHHHYYCNINFKDGTHSYIRVSRKHLKNLVLCGLQLPPDIVL